MCAKYDDVKLQEPKNIAKFKDALSNKLEYAKKSYHPSFNGLLSRFKKVFGITPASLKSADTKEAKDARELALYLLVHYTNDMQKIADAFGVPKSLLEEMRSDTALIQKYKAEEELFFEGLVSDALDNLYANLVFSEMLSQKQEHDQNELIDRIIQRQLSKKTTYHPSLHKYFSEAELEQIFNYPKDLLACADEIQEIKRFLKEEKITSTKEIFKICKMMFPSYIAGLYDGEFCIEISTDVIKGEVLIEQDDYQNKRINILSKSDLLKLYETR